MKVRRSWPEMTAVVRRLARRGDFKYHPRTGDTGREVMHDRSRIRFGLLAVVLVASCGARTLTSDSGVPDGRPLGGAGGGAGVAGAAGGGGPGWAARRRASRVVGRRWEGWGTDGAGSGGRGGTGGISGIAGVSGAGARGGMGGTAGSVGGRGGRAARRAGGSVGGRGGMAAERQLRRRLDRAGSAASGVGAASAASAARSAASRPGRHRRPCWSRRRRGHSRHGSHGGLAASAGIRGGTGGSAGRGGTAGVGCPTCGVTILPIPGRDVVYNAARNELYVSVAGDAADVPEHDRDRRPDDVVGLSAIPIGSDPGALALSDDGSTLWVGIDGAHAFRKVTMTSTPPVVGPLIHLPKARPDALLQRDPRWPCWPARRCRWWWSLSDGGYDARSACSTTACSGRRP